MTTFTEQKRFNEKQLQGLFGEILVAEYLTRQGLEVDPGGDWYDDQKDGLINGTTPYEVKTCVRWYSENGFAFDRNQYEKIYAADYVFIVEIPPKDTPIRIYTLENRAAPRSKIFENSKRIIYSIYNCVEVCTIHDPDAIDYLRRITTSHYV